MGTYHSNIRVLAVLTFAIVHQRSLALVITHSEIRIFSYVALVIARHQRRPLNIFERSISEHFEMIHSKSNVILIKNYV